VDGDQALLWTLALSTFPTLHCLALGRFGDGRSRAGTASTTLSTTYNARAREQLPLATAAEPRPIRFERDQQLGGCTNDYPCSCVRRFSNESALLSLNAMTYRPTIAQKPDIYSRIPGKKLTVSSYLLIAGGDGGVWLNVAIELHEV